MYAFAGSDGGSGRCGVEAGKPGGAEEGRPGPPAGSYRRESGELEFDRVSFFSDAVYAIAMTLLVVDLHAPEFAGPQDDFGALAGALLGEWPQVFGFFLGFILLGRFWRAHHVFFASLRSIDGRFITLNLVYLAVVAFTPFPVGMLSDYEGNPAAFLMFAACMIGISGLEVLMYVHAVRHGHTRERLTPAVYRYGVACSAAPVVVMTLSLPLAAFSSTAALLSWLLLVPVGRWLKRREPAEYARVRYPPTM